MNLKQQQSVVDNERPHIMFLPDYDLHAAEMVSIAFHAAAFDPHMQGSLTGQKYNIATNLYGKGAAAYQLGNTSSRMITEVKQR